MSWEINASNSRTRRLSLDETSCQPTKLRITGTILITSRYDVESSGLVSSNPKDNDVNLPIPCSALGYVNVEKSCMVLKKGTTSL
jgi:hypothetical protein